jgi:hypothetical protein
MNHNTTHNFFLKICDILLDGDCHAVPRDEALEILTKSMQDESTSKKLNKFINDAALAQTETLQVSFCFNNKVNFLCAVPKSQKLDSRYAL